MMQDYFALTDRVAPELRAISDFIHANPELGFEEHLASAKVADFLRKHGFAVEQPCGGLDTAVCGTYSVNATADTPTVCVCGEYDALEGYGHACGHNLIAAAGLCAAWTAATYAREHHLPLNLRFLGTPAEEAMGGKIKLLNAGAFNGVDMAIMAHGSGRTATDPGDLGVARAYITFHGKSSHAAGAPQLGINALDAIVYFYSDMLEWKQGIGEAERVHGIITKGGDAANIIPDFTQAFFYVRSNRPERLLELKRMLEASAAKGAAKTGCTYEVNWVSEYQPTKVNRPINLRYAAYWAEAGKQITIYRGDEGRASTDMGDVTQVIPGTQFRFSITDEQPCPAHSIAFREAAATDTGFKSAMQTGAIMARILLDFSTDPAFRAEVRADFDRQTTAPANR